MIATAASAERLRARSDFRACDGRRKHGHRNSRVRQIPNLLERRKHELIRQGHTWRTPEGGLRARRDLLPALERQEIERVGRKLATERGLAFDAIEDGQAIRGKLIGSAQLVSGRFAMVDVAPGCLSARLFSDLDKRRRSSIALLCLGPDHDTDARARDLKSAKACGRRSRFWQDQPRPCAPRRCCRVTYTVPPARKIMTSATDLLGLHQSN